MIRHCIRPTDGQLVTEPWPSVSSHSADIVSLGQRMLCTPRTNGQDAVTHEFGRKLGSSESGQRVPAWVLDSLRAVVLRLDDPAETQVNPLMMIVLEILDGSPDPLSARQAA